MRAKMRQFIDLHQATSILGRIAVVQRQMIGGGAAECLFSNAIFNQIALTFGSTATTLLMNKLIG